MDIFSTYMYNEDWEREGGIRGRVGGGGGGGGWYVTSLILQGQRCQLVTKNKLAWGVPKIN